MIQKEELIRSIRLSQSQPATMTEKQRSGPADLSRYTLTGIILAPGGNKALIRDASGKGIVVSEGEKLGRSDSVKIAKIMKDRVFVDTKTEDDFKPGKISFVQRELKLQKPFSESYEIE